MRRIAGPTATQDNKFTQGNASTGVAATQVTDTWLNDTQETLIDPIVAAGLTPNGDVDQLTKAIRLLNVSIPGGSFAARQKTTPNNTVRVTRGYISDGTTITAIAEQNTAAFAAPVNNPRIDLVHVDRATGLVGVATGTEAASPAAPALPAGKMPVALVTLPKSVSVVTDSMISDVRAFTGGVPVRASTSVKNLRIRPVVAGTASPTVYQITADEVVMPDATGKYVRHTNVNVTVDSSITGAGGRQTGLTLAASTWYGLFLISNGTAIAGLMAGSANEGITTFPSGYSFYMRVGSVKTHTDNTLLRSGQNDKVGFWMPTTGTTLTLYPNLGTTGTYAALAWGAWAPPTISELDVAPRAGSGGNNILYVGENSVDSRAIGGGWQGVGFPSSPSVRIPVTGPNYYSQATAGNCICGWVDSI